MLIEIEYTDIQYSTTTEASYFEVQIESCATKYKRSNLVKHELPLIEPIRDLDEIATEEAIGDGVAEVIRNRYISDNSDVMRLLSMLKCDSRQSTRQSMMHVYSQFLDWTKESQFDCCDEFLYLVDVEALDVRLLISILMASNPIKNMLSYRGSYFSKVRKITQKRYGLIEASKILHGLK